MNLHRIEDLFENEVRAIMAGLMELPAKVANPLLNKIDQQFAVQLQANAAAAQVEATTAGGPPERVNPSSAPVVSTVDGTAAVEGGTINPDSAE